MTNEKSIVEEKAADKPVLKTAKPKVESIKVNDSTQVAAVTEEKAEAIVYVGQSLPGIGLQQFAIFKNGVPSYLEPHIEKCRAIKSLMVPVSQLSAARRNLTVQGSAEDALNKKVQSYMRGEA